MADGYRGVASTLKGGGIMRSECISEAHRHKHKELEWPFKLLVMRELHSQGHKLQAKVVWEILMCKDYIGATNVPKERNR